MTSNRLEVYEKVNPISFYAGDEKQLDYSFLSNILIPLNLPKNSLLDNTSKTLFN